MTRNGLNPNFPQLKNKILQFAMEHRKDCRLPTTLYERHKSGYCAYEMKYKHENVVFFGMFSEEIKRVEIVCSYPFRSLFEPLAEEWNKQFKKEYLQNRWGNQ